MEPCRLCGSPEGIRDDAGWACARCGWRVGAYIDPELPPPRIHVVYYLRQGDRVKIGTTFQPRQRFAAIWHEELLAFERGDRVLERQRHDQFADERYPGSEWFRMSRRLRRHVASIAAGIDDPWAQHARWISEAYARISH